MLSASGRFPRGGVDRVALIITAVAGEFLGEAFHGFAERECGANVRELSSQDCLVCHQRPLFSAGVLV